jgi:phage-related protein
VVGRKIVLTNGFIKKTTKIPQGEINLAKVLTVKTEDT